MFAVVKTGGKQYRVSPGDVLAVERLEGNVGDSVKLDEVLALGGGDKPQVGSPLVKDASVTAEIVAQDKADKVIIFKKKRRHTYRRKMGHRQLQTILRVLEIPGAKLDAAAKAAKSAAAKAAKEDKKAAAKPAAKKEAKADKPKADKPKAAKAKAPAKKKTEE